MGRPQIVIDMERIERNAARVVTRCRDADIAVIGVTKGTCGMPQVARAMLRGGVAGIGESRFENIRRLRDSGIDAPIMLLRSPPLSMIEEVIKSVDISLNSEVTIIQELSRVAMRMGRVHDIILMVDLGDLREGVWPSDLIPTVEQLIELKGVRIAGVGTNLSCFGAIMPTEVNLGDLVAHAEALKTTFGLDLSYVSGGNSSSLPLLLTGAMPKGINQLRLGEAILQGGRDTFLDQPWTELDRDAFLLSGELLEVKIKPSMPIGISGVDAFGGRPVFENKGERLRGILNIGREDVAVDGLRPVEQGVQVLGASSDHLVVDLTDRHPPPAVGDTLSFRMTYSALLAAMTSEYVEKAPMRNYIAERRATKVSIFAEPEAMPIIGAHQLEARLTVLSLTPSHAGAPDTEAVAAALGQGSFPLLLGSSHLATYSGLAALARQADAFGLIWVDPRAGLSPSAEPGANSVLYHALGGAGPMHRLAPNLSPENIVLIGLRETTPSEAKFIRASRITVFTMTDIDAIGIREVMRQALRIAAAGTRGYYVSYSPSVTDFPGYTLGSGGITVRETHQAMEAIAQAGGMLAMDVTGLDVALELFIGAECCGFVLSSFGKTIL